MATYYTAEVDWNVGSISDKQEKEQAVTVTGAALGDFAEVSSSLNAIDLEISAQVTASNEVTVSISNLTTGSLDIGTPKMRLWVTSLSGQHQS